MKNPQLKIASAILASVGIFASTNVSASYCGTDTNQNHANAGRAEMHGYVYARTIGSGEDLGLYYSDSATLEETSPGYYEVVANCDGTSGGNGAGTATAYEHAEETPMETIIDKTGNYGLATAGGHFVTSSTGSIPWNQALNCDGATPPAECLKSVTIPVGATIEHALLFYTGSIGKAGGDFTPDLLDTADDAANNGIWMTVGGQKQGPFDPVLRKPNGESSVGSSAKITPDITFNFGTLQGTTTALYGNRIDVTNLFTGQSGTIDFRVHAPENLDTEVNSDAANGGNDMGNTTHNTCSSVGNWSLLVVYSHNSEDNKQIVVKDDFLQAWDYTYIHKGVWNRPKTTINHAPMAAGAKFHIYGATGLKAGYVLPNQPTCTCGCGGAYNIEKTSTQPTSYDKTAYFYSFTHEDPASVVAANDPMNRDKNSLAYGEYWGLKSYDASGGLTTQPINGNDWTLFQSGTNKLTEFPNLYEGEAVSADTTQPLTNENTSSVAGEVYAGHPWNGRGDVTYNGVGHSVSVVEVEPVEEALELGSTSSTFFFKGDQKDVFKPQARVTVRYIAMTIPVDSSSQGEAPVITLTGNSVIELTEGASFSEPGYTAIDAEDGDITNNVSVDCGALPIGLPVSIGSYLCTYSVTDLDDNTTSVTRSINVSPGVTPNEAPEITLAGNNPVTFTAGETYAEPGYSVSDDNDSGLESSVVVACDFNQSTALVEGTYTCTYNVQDLDGADADEKTRTVVVDPAPQTGCTDYYDTTLNHVNAGRAAYSFSYPYGYKTIGGNDSLSSYGSSWVKETSSGYFEKGQCP